MQSYAENAQQSNIFTQLRALRAKRAQELSGSEVNKIISLRNDKTGSDEALIAIRVVLFVVTAFTVYCAFLFYTNTFSKVFSPTATLLAALALAPVGEVCKIYLTHRALRSVFFGWIFRSFWTLGGWAFILFLGIGAYAWSIKVSTDGMNQLTSEMAENNTPKATLSAEISKSTVDIDKMIEAAQDGQITAMNTKWKGTTTVRAQRIAENGAKSLDRLQEQRAVIVEQVTRDYANGKQVRAENISNWAQWIRDYGGYMELVAALCLFSIVFFERRLVSENMKIARGPAPTPEEDRQNAQKRNYDDPQPTQRTTQNGSPAFQNTSNSPDRETVTLSGQNARALSETDADYIYLRLKRLKGWDDNFQKTGNKPETVARNMCQILNEIGIKMQDPDFKPYLGAVESLLEYIQGTGFPVLHENGFTYKYQTELINLCLSRLPARAAA